MGISLHFKTTKGKQHPWTGEMWQDTWLQGIGFPMTNWSPAQTCIAGAVWDQRIAALFFGEWWHFLACLDFWIDKMLDGAKPAFCSWEPGLGFLSQLRLFSLGLSFCWSPAKCLIGAPASGITSTLLEPLFCVLIFPKGKQCSSVKRLDSVSPTSYYYYKSYYFNETGIYVLENPLCWQKN